MAGFVYLDYNATTPIDPEVAEEMRPYLFGSVERTTQVFGNPSSSHSVGVQAKKAVELARKRVADAINAKETSEVVFTSGGSESNNLALKGYYYAHKARGNHIIISSVEHPAVEEVAKYLESEHSAVVTRVPVDSDGIIVLEELEKAIRPTTILVSVMHANNETGSIQPLREIAEILNKKLKEGVVSEKIAFHTDAAQSFGKIKVDVQEFQVDMLTIVGHKFYGPKGIGALYIRNGIKLQKLIHGAGHELGLRAGTENVLHMVGLGKACELAHRDLEKNAKHVQELRDQLHEGLLAAVPNLKLNGHKTKRLPNTLNVSFPKLQANTILAEIEDQIGASAGAACHTDKVDISSVLAAMKVPIDIAMGTIRLSTGKYSTKEEIDSALSTIIFVVKRLQPSTSSEEEESCPYIDPATVKLTHFTHGLGCACKLRPQALEKVLEKLPTQRTDPNVLVGPETGDDAAVYKLSEEIAVVSTLDFFTPIVDSPFHFGAIAAANALSDVYAMGGKPIFGLNIVGFPSNRLPLEVLSQILAGAQSKAEEAGITIIGGHTIDDLEPKYGMAVTGTIHPSKILKNKGAEAGDVLVLTKPIGTGIITTAIRRGLVDNDVADHAIKVMSTLNNKAAEAMAVVKSGSIHACTDVTGFGLMGHLKGMISSKSLTTQEFESNVDALVYDESVPKLPDAKRLCGGDIIPGGTKNNHAFLEPFVEWSNDLSNTEQLLLCDAQTSGGLLVSIEEGESQKYISALKAAGIQDVAIIGRIVQGTGKIKVYKHQ